MQYFNFEELVGIHKEVVQDNIFKRMIQFLTGEDRKRMEITEKYSFPLSWYAPMIPDLDWELFDKEGVGIYTKRQFCLGLLGQDAEDYILLQLEILLTNYEGIYWEDGDGLLDFTEAVIVCGRTAGGLPQNRGPTALARVLCLIEGVGLLRKNLPFPQVRKEALDGENKDIISMASLMLSAKCVSVPR